LATIAEKFQPQLPGYRLVNHTKVARGDFDVDQFTSQVGDLAKALGVCIVDDRKLQEAVIPLLESLDSQLRVNRWIQLDAVVVEAALILCHEDQRSYAYVGDIANQASALLMARGEPHDRELTARAVGETLRALGVRIGPRGGGGYRVEFDEGTRRKLNELARELELPIGTGEDSARAAGTTHASQ